MGLIQKEPNDTVHLWNTHLIRQSQHETVHGVPDELYFVPQISKKRYGFYYLTG